MTTRILILWTNLINLVCIVGVGIILLIGGHNLLTLIPLGIILFVSLINSLFAIDNKVFLSTYDDIKDLKAKTEAQLKAADNYVGIIGQHEALKMYAGAIGIGDKFDGLVTDMVKDTTSGIKITDDYIKNKVDEVRSDIKDIPQELKTEGEKVAIDIKEVFEEKAANNIIKNPATTKPPYNNESDNLAGTV